jgi:3-methyladenine DNA glycosylase AlkC
MEPLKNIYSSEYISSLAFAISQYYTDFNTYNFTNSIMNSQWDSLELKERMSHIAATLREYLPKKYHNSLEILKKASTHFNGMEAMYFQEYVALYGLEDWDESMSALEVFTQDSSSEFAIREFILANQDRAMNQLKDWAKSDSVHTRRLSSEGCRPRLPWAKALPAFKKDPTKVLEILELLKFDNEKYVQKSVANNLNDISKDNPELVKSTLTRWQKESVSTYIIKHALRTLLKSGDKEALSLIGIEPTNATVEIFSIEREVKLGDELEFSFVLSSQKLLGTLRVEYELEFVRANNKRSKKVFFISQKEHQSNSIEITKKYSFKKISTRKYYKGEHKLSIIVNGDKLTTASFELF